MAATTGSRELFSRIAGHPALDLVNTVEWRLSPTRFEEDLLGYDDVLRWGAQIGVWDEDVAGALTEAAQADPSLADAETARFRSLREAVYGALYEGADAAPLMAEYAAAVSVGGLERDGDDYRWRLPVGLELPRRRMAIEAVELLTHTDLSLLAQCEDADCGWVFLDTSPRHNRRWCVAADCGNRNRVRAHYERLRARSAPAGPPEDR